MGYYIFKNYHYGCINCLDLLGGKAPLVFWRYLFSWNKAWTFTSAKALRQDLQRDCIGSWFLLLIISG